jgi:two-component system, NtrC family, sensor kinase
MSAVMPDLPEARHSLMEGSPVPMAELERVDQVVRYVNPAFCRMVGKSRKALVGTPFAETAQEGDSCLAVLDRVYRTGEPETYTDPEHPGPHPAYWCYAVWPLLGAQERPVGVMMQVTETTKFLVHARAMNEALLISSVRQHELTEAAERLNKARGGNCRPQGRQPGAARERGALPGFIRLESRGCLFLRYLGCD